MDTNESRGDFGAFRLSASETPPSSALATAIVTPAAAAEGVQRFAARAAEIAEAEWRFFGQQTYDLARRRTHAGHTEAEPGYFERVGTFWLDGTSTHGLDGRNTGHPWSAAFMSWVMRTAGAGARFRYSTQHSVYISQGIRDYVAKRDAAGYWTERLSDSAAAVGDIVCWARQPGIDYDHQALGDYEGHADLVVDVQQDAVQVIGGNVGDSVTKRPLAVDDTGRLKPVVENGETLFGLMKCRL